MDYKERWQSYYDQAEKNGEADPGFTADQLLADYFADRADRIRDEMKDVRLGEML